MTLWVSVPGAAQRSLCACLAFLPLLSGCALFHHGPRAGCAQRPFQGSSVGGRGLVVPAGLSPPDTRNGVKIPTLDETEVPRPVSAPCLAQPPSFAAGEAGALPARNTLPGTASAPVPIPLPGPATEQPPAQPSAPATQPT